MATRLKDGEMVSLQIRPDQGHALAELRSWARSKAGAWPDLELVLTELVSNARQHGEFGVVTVGLERRRNRIAVMVTNRNHSPPPELQRLDGPFHSTAIGGRGLRIAAAIADDLRIEQVADLLKVTAILPCDPTFE